MRAFGRFVSRFVLIFLTVALSFLLPRESEAETADDLLGRWCNDVNHSTYTFTSNKLVVRFNDGEKKVLVVQKIDAGTGWINVIWENSTNTIFIDFKDSTMKQVANTAGDMGPERLFHRC
jgi:hypothetical protein